jgi:hypothetical protein
MSGASAGGLDADDYETAYRLDMKPVALNPRYPTHSDRRRPVGFLFE